MKRMMRMIDSRLRAGLAFLAAAMLISVPVSAGQIVYFLNGKVVTVKSIEKGDKVTILEFEGGGRVGIPTHQIARIKDLGTISRTIAQVTPGVPAGPALVASPGSTWPVISPAAGDPPVAAAGPTGPGSGGVQRQPGTAGSRRPAVGPTMGDRRGMGRPRSDSSQVNPQAPLPPVSPVSQGTPTPDTNAGGAKNESEGTTVPE